MQSVSCLHTLLSRSAHRPVVMNLNQRATRPSKAAQRSTVKQHPVSVHFRRRVTFQCSSLPSIREFILSECPLPGTDGLGYRERPHEATLTSSCVAVSESSLAVPGQRRLFSVNEAQLQQIIRDQGKVVICCCDESSDVFKLISPPRGGSYCCLAAVVGLQRLSQAQQQQQQQALIRVVVTDRVAVQSVASSDPSVLMCQSSVLRDRWTYRVRTGAVQQHWDTGSSNSSSSSGGGSSSLSRGDVEVMTVIDQLSDVITELDGLLREINITVQRVVDGCDGHDDAGTNCVLQQMLVKYEAAEELQHIIDWVDTTTQHEPSHTTTTTSSSTSSSSDDPYATSVTPSPPAHASGHLLLETAWRLSFAPHAAVGLMRALAHSSSTGSSSSSSSASLSPSRHSAKVLGVTDLGVRLEAAVDLCCEFRRQLAAHLALR